MSSPEWWIPKSSCFPELLIWRRLHCTPSPGWLPFGVEPISIGEITLLFSGYNFLGTDTSLSFLTSAWPFRSREALECHFSARLPLCPAASHRWSPFFFFLGQQLCHRSFHLRELVLPLVALSVPRLLAVDKDLIQRQWDVPESCKYVHVSQPENVVSEETFYFLFLFFFNFSSEVEYQLWERLWPSMAKSCNSSTRFQTSGACLSCSVCSGHTGGIASQELCPVPHALPIRLLLLTNVGGGCQQLSSKMSLTLFPSVFCGCGMFSHTKETVLSPSMVSKV